MTGLWLKSVTCISIIEPQFLEFENKMSSKMNFQLYIRSEHSHTQNGLVIRFNVTPNIALKTKPLFILYTNQNNKVNL